MNNLDYKNAGVNLVLEDEVSQLLYEASQLTWKNRKGKLGEVVEIFEDFSGLCAIHVGRLPSDTYMNINFDGVGTKIEFAERLTKHDTVAYDLFAMVCDDALARGAEPVIIGSILDFQKIKRIDLIKQLAAGYVNAARDAQVAVVNGEVAELGVRVSGYGQLNYTWGAGLVWFARKDRMFTGHHIKQDDILVGLREEGFRSNGLSLVKKIMEITHGKSWHKATFNGQNIAELALRPSRIYSQAVVAMFGGFDGEPKAKIHGVCHITGGGMPGKLRRTLKPNRLGAYIHDPFEPSDLMHYCQEKGKVTDIEAYKTWNMGQGMIIITPSPDEVMRVAIEYGIESKIIGQITKEQNIKEYEIKDFLLTHKKN